VRDVAKGREQHLTYGRRPGGGPRGDRGRRDEIEESPYVERVVKIRRVSKVVKGGRNLSFNAMVVVGDGAGNVGASLGKAKAVPDAVRKGTANARKNMRPVALRGTTIPHEVTAEFGAAKVLLKPAAPGTGIVAGGGVRAVVEAAGVKDVLSKTFGSANTINIVSATMKALETLRDPRAETARRKGVGVATSEG
jgi:small subunit ribosomal protein S5